MPIEGLLPTDGATLFYSIEGSGRPALILSGGAADTGVLALLRQALAERFRVITFDRRGLSGSRVERAAPAPTMATYAEDAIALIETLTSEPPFVFGSSFGGLTGLELIARRPELVQHLVVHEAPTGELLPPGEEKQLRTAQAAMADAFHQQGMQAALKISARLAAIDPEDREQGIEPEVLTTQRGRNLNTLLSVDVPAVRDYRIDLPALRRVADRIFPAAGHSTRHTLLHHCALGLAKAIERPLIEFPGGHTAWQLRPSAFALRLMDLFRDGEGPGRAAGHGAASFKPL